MNLNLTHANVIDELGFVEKKFYYELGLTLRIHRRSKNFSQEYMATKLKISQNAYSKIEAGKCSCSVYRLMQILELLDLDLQHVLIVQKNRCSTWTMTKI